MTLRVKFSLRLLFGLTLFAGLFLGILTSRNSWRQNQYRSLQDQGVLLDTDSRPGYWPPPIASFFPAAFAEPRIAWIHFKNSGQYIHIGDQKYLGKDVKTVFDELISEVRSVGFEDIRFASVTQTSGFFIHSSFDILKMYPDSGDGLYWSTPDDAYETQMALNRQTFGLER